MDWMNALQDVVQRYTGESGGAAPAPQDAHQDFQQVSRTAPRDVVASGISQAFRSDQTPPFGQMVANLFGQSDPNQRAGLLNRLLGSVGPGAATTLPGLGGLSSLFATGTVTPDQATQVSPDQVQQMATHAERQNPSVVDEVSHFYAQHPDVMKAAGGLALTIALQHMLHR
ncbi:MAG: hypothetical protein JO336_10890 [Acidobacteriia bacterium]|nr:hypothetical protein [Terriglobia bacterium]